MRRVVWAQLRRRPARTLALLVGILVATTSFTVLTATARTAQLRTTATVGAHFRGAFDILVRPQGTNSRQEQRSGTVQANFLSGIYGGISMQQWRTVQRLPGVEVAAPIAMVGTVLPTTFLPVPVGRYMTGSARQLFRIRATWISDRGLTGVAEPDSFVYVTSSRLELIREQRGDGALATEVLADGRRVRTCKSEGEASGSKDPFGAGARSRLECWSTVTGRDGAGDFLGLLTARDPGYPLVWSVPLLVAGVDPVSEAKLGHLDAAVVTGRYLRPDDAQKLPGVPVLVSRASGVDETVSVQVERLADPTGPLPLISVEDLPRRLQAPGVAVGTVTYTGQAAYDRLLPQLAGQTNTNLLQDLSGFWQSGPISYVGGGGKPLSPTTTRNPDSTWTTQDGLVVVAPMDNADIGFRTLTPHFLDPSGSGAVLRTVGVFDPAKLPAFDPLTDVDLGAYRPVTAQPGDGAARQALGGQDLLPSSNLAGNLRQPPQLITTLDGIAPFYGPGYGGTKPSLDPISVIRVRVAGVRGADPVSRERIRQVAQQIAARTRLQVDLVVGSSPSPTLVRVPKGTYGRPPLLLSERWIKKNVAVTLLTAIDRKSLVLFVLILAVCALFVGNAASAAVRSRRGELGVLACLGWSRPRLYSVVLSEVLTVGLLAGTAGSLVAIPLGRALGLPVSTGRALLAIPAAVALALAAAAVPAYQASRADPGAAVRPAVGTGGGHRSPRGVPGLALSNVLRVPGRSTLAALSLAIGTTGLILLLGITFAFRGVAVGSLLGDAVAVQVRGVDYLAVTLLAALGVLAVADVLFLNLRERAGELATLRATGWTEAALSRLVLAEGLLLGLGGALLGALLGLAGTAAFTRTLPWTVWALSLTVVLLATGVTAAASLLPARLLRRLPTARLLAEDE